MSLFDDIDKEGFEALYEVHGQTLSTPSGAQLRACVSDLPQEEVDAELGSSGQNFARVLVLVSEAIAVGLRFNAVLTSTESGRTYEVLRRVAQGQRYELTCRMNLP